MLQLPILAMHENNIVAVFYLIQLFCLFACKKIFFKKSSKSKKVAKCHFSWTLLSS